MLPRVRPEVPHALPSALAPESDDRPALAAFDGRVERTASRMLHAYMRFAGRRGRLRWCDAAGHVLDSRAVGASIDRLRVTIEPIIVTYWIADALAVASLPLMDAAFARLFATLTCVVDETFTGRVAGRYIRAIGGRYALVAMPSD